MIIKTAHGGVSKTLVTDAGGGLSGCKNAWRWGNPDVSSMRCNRVAQLCDVGIQQPWKLSIKKSYHKEIVSKILEQLKNKTQVKDELVALDSRLPMLCD